jgi:hypothetical protein
MYCSNYGSAEAARINLERKEYWLLEVVFLDKLTIAHLVNIYSTFYVTQMLVTVFKKTLATCTCLEPDEISSGQPIVVLKFILILSYDPCDLFL